MRRVNHTLPLIIKHTAKDRFVRTLKMRGNNITVGSSQGARLRLLSSSIAGICCLIQRTAHGWTIIDLGSQPDLKLNGRPFIEATLDGKAVLEVGDHRIEVTPVGHRRPLFTEHEGEIKKGRCLTVVKWHGRVVESGTSESEMSVYLADNRRGIEICKVPLPRLVPLKKQGLRVDPEMKKPMTSMALLLFVFFAILFGLPMPKEEIKPKDNVYTRMIFDSKILTQKRKQLVSMGVKTPRGTGNGNGTISEGAKGQQSKTLKAVSSLRQAGLESLIGRIASRASKSARMLASLAATPTANAAVNAKDLGGFGAPPSGGAATGQTGILGNGKGYKIGGIGTGGKGGGTGDYKAGTGLGTGSVGNGEVGLDDTDTIIEGGLDKEVIAAVIREHLGQIRYCYERQLSANPDLYGKVKVKFTIDAGGLVETQDIGQSTLKSAMVEECILRRIATWKFPKPRGGTKVLVSYPFLFKSVN